MNPYEPPNCHGQADTSTEPSVFWNRTGNFVLLGFSVFALFAIWFGGGDAIGGGHYHASHGLFEYYEVESEWGVITTSEIHWPNLIASIIATLLVVGFALPTIWQLMHGARDRSCNESPK